ncbi:unnamed protein product, partial [Prorocentrum cordatum]
MAAYAALPVSEGADTRARRLPGLARRSAARCLGAFERRPRRWTQRGCQPLPRLGPDEIGGGRVLTQTVRLQEVSSPPRLDSADNIAALRQWGGGPGTDSDSSAPPSSAATGCAGPRDAPPVRRSVDPNHRPGAGGALRATVTVVVAATPNVQNGALLENGLTPSDTVDGLAHRISGRRRRRPPLRQAQKKAQEALHCEMWKAKLEPDAIMIAFRPCSRTPPRLPRDPSPRRADVVDGVHRSALVSYNAGISACEKGKQWQPALALLSEMREVKLEP